MKCETCLDALDDTSVLELEDHACEGGECQCICPQNRRAGTHPFTCGYCGRGYSGSLMRHIIDSRGQPWEPKHNA